MDDAKEAVINALVSHMNDDQLFDAGRDLIAENKNEAARLLAWKIAFREQNRYSLHTMVEAIKNNN